MDGKIINMDRNVIKERKCKEVWRRHGDEFERGEKDEIEDKENVKMLTI